MEEFGRWYARGSALMEPSFGNEHDLVMHAIIPYRFGGGLDRALPPFKWKLV